MSFTSTPAFPHHFQAGGARCLTFRSLLCLDETSEGVMCLKSQLSSISDGMSSGTRTGGMNQHLRGKGPIREIFPRKPALGPSRPHSVAVYTC